MSCWKFVAQLGRHRKQATNTGTIVYHLWIASWLSYAHIMDESLSWIKSLTPSLKGFSMRLTRTHTHSSSLLLFLIGIPQSLTCIMMGFSQNIPRARMCLVNVSGSQTAVWPMGDIHTFMNKWIHLPSPMAVWKLLADIPKGPAQCHHESKHRNIPTGGVHLTQWSAMINFISPLFCGSNILQAKPYPSLLIQAIKDGFPRVRVHIPLVFLEPWY